MKSVLAVILIAIGSMVPMAFSEHPQEDDTLVLKKLTHAHKLLEGVAMSKFDQIEENAGALCDMVESDAWGKGQPPEFMLYSRDFLNSLQGLRRAAAEQSSERAGTAYVRMATHCFDCHQYVRDKE